MYKFGKQYEKDHRHTGLHTCNQLTNKNKKILRYLNETENTVLPENRYVFGVINAGCGLWLETGEHKEFSSVHKVLTYLCKLQAMAPSKCHIHEDENLSIRLVPNIFDRPSNIRFARGASNSLWVPAPRVKEALETGVSGQPIGRLEAGLNICNTNQSSKQGVPKYNKISIQDLLCDDGQSEKREEYVCKMWWCNQKFTSKIAMENHFDSVHLLRTFHHCPNCFEPFFLTYDLHKHVRYSLLFNQSHTIYQQSSRSLLTIVIYAFFVVPKTFSPVYRTRLKLVSLLLYYVANTAFKLL